MDNRDAEIARLRAELIEARAALAPLDAVVHELEIEDSETSPADAIQALRDKIARLRKAAEWMVSASDNRLPTKEQDGQHPAWIRMGIDGLRRALTPQEDKMAPLESGRPMTPWKERRDD